MARSSQPIFQQNFFTWIWARFSFFPDGETCEGIVGEISAAPHGNWHEIRAIHKSIDPKKMRTFVWGCETSFQFCLHCAPAISVSFLTEPFSGFGHFQLSPFSEAYGLFQNDLMGGGSKTLLDVNLVFIREMAPLTPCLTSTQVSSNVYLRNCNCGAICWT